MYENSEIGTNPSMRSGKSQTRLKPISGSALGMRFEERGDAYNTLTANNLLRKDQLFLGSTKEVGHTLSQAKIPKKQSLPPLEKDANNAGAAYSSGYENMAKLLDQPDRYVMSRVMLGKD